MNETLISMETLLSKRVLVRAPDGNYSPDESWRPRTIAIYSSLYFYLKERDLLTLGHSHVSNIERLILRKSDLSPLAFILWQSGAVYRWIGSFDRNPNKKLDNYQILDKALRQDGGSA